ncbi:unnamed protein product [Brassica oleracea]
MDELGFSEKPKLRRDKDEDFLIRLSKSEKPFLAHEEPNRTLARKMNKIFFFLIGEISKLSNWEFFLCWRSPVTKKKKEKSWRSPPSILEKKKKVHDFIKRASSRLDPLSPFESFRRYTKNDLSVYLEPGRGDRLSSSLKQHIRKLLKVPILDLSSIKWVQPNTLVRFRGMIQDMLGNEFYAGAYKVPGQNQWTECSSVELKNRFLDFTGQKQGETCRVDEAGLNGSPSLSWTVSWSNSSEEATPKFSSARRPTISATLTPTTTLVIFIIMIFAIVLIIMISF